MALERVARVLALIVCLGLLVACRASPGIETYAATAVACIVTGAWVLSSATEMAVWAAYVGAFVIFAVLRTLADETGIPARFDYVISAERTLFRTVPTVWLQDRLIGKTVGGPLDWSVAGVYLSYFFVPHVAALWLWLRQRWLFTRFVLAFLITLFGGLAICFAIPTAPPSLASREGRLPPVTSVVRELTSARSPDAYEAGERIAGANEVAAMPSLHVAVTTVLALALWQVRRRWGSVGALYVVAMAFSLLYNGSHYAVDLLAGVGLAGLAWVLAEWLAQSNARVTD
jgi:membrane-associated phospholipid phosphatase